MKNRSGKPYHPFVEHPPCVCPNCFRDTLAYRQTDTIFARVDEDGIPGDFVCNTDIIFHCLNCGFTSTDYIITDSGWRWNPFDDRQYIIDQNKKLTETRTIDNPFLKLSEE